MPDAVTRSVVKDDFEDVFDVSMDLQMGILTPSPSRPEELTTSWWKINHNRDGELTAHLDGLHVTWAHLEKKRMRLRTNTKTLKDLCSQSLETV
ncbi:hypothetical protein Tco_0688652 [Tanacetum coccineum]